VEISQAIIWYIFFTEVISALRQTSFLKKIIYELFCTDLFFVFGAKNKIVGLIILGCSVIIPSLQVFSLLVFLIAENRGVSLPKILCSSISNGVNSGFLLKNDIINIFR